MLIFSAQSEVRPDSQHRPGKGTAPRGHLQTTWAERQEAWVLVLAEWSWKGLSVPQVHYLKIEIMALALSLLEVDMKVLNKDMGL
jgi:hypothetical protein